ncbi:MAG TPA: hypothetical protein VF228_01185 [Iamia sp.]
MIGRWSSTADMHHVDEEGDIEMKRMTKPTVALVSAVAMLVLLATPSAAGPITGGTITVNLTPALSVTLGTTTFGCDASTVTASGDFFGGSIALSIPEGGFNYGTPNPHVLVAQASGTYTLNPTTGGTGTFAISGAISTTATGTTTARIHARTTTTTPPDTCVAGMSECGPIVTTITFTGTFTGTVTTTGLVGTGTINGSGTLGAFGCSAPFSAINNKTITIVNLTFDLP